MSRFLHIFRYHHEDLKLFQLEQQQFLKRDSAERYFFSDVLTPIKDCSFAEVAIDVLVQEDGLENFCKVAEETVPFLNEVRIDTVSIGHEPHCSFNDLVKILPFLKLKAKLKNPTYTYILTRIGTTWIFGEKVDECPKRWVEHRTKPETVSSAIPHLLARVAVETLKSMECQSIIDYCCGSGTFIIEAASLDLHCTAIDLNPTMAQMTARNMAHFNYPCTTQSADASLFELIADAGIVDFPYGFHCQRDETNELNIIRNVLKHTKKSLFIHGEDISEKILKENGKILIYITIPAVNVLRHLFFCESL
jgi:predicted RNA methylase